MPEIYMANDDKPDILESLCHKQIRLTNHFILACKDPLLSFRNSPVCYPPGPAYQFFQAVRIEDPITVMDVVSSVYQGNDGYYKRMNPAFDASVFSGDGIFTLPEGSLLMRAFDTASEKARGPWFALNPDQEKWQNLQRVHLPYSEDDANVSSAHSLSFMMSVVSSWKKDAQQQAQMNDIILLQKIKNKKTLVGRVINFLTF